MSLFSCRNRDPAIFVGEDMNHRTLFSIGAVVDRGWSTAGETGVRVVPSATDASRATHNPPATPGPRICFSIKLEGPFYPSSTHRHCPTCSAAASPCGPGGFGLLRV